MSHNELAQQRLGSHRAVVRLVGYAIAETELFEHKRCELRELEILAMRFFELVGEEELVLFVEVSIF